MTVEASASQKSSLADIIDARIARLDTRTPDWDALKFQEKVNPNYRRAQMRYVGTGATGVQTDSNTVPSEHFTLSTMVIPAGHEGPLHTHHDVEEVFFVLKGQMTCYMEKDGERVERTLHERDAISVPAGVARGERNDGAEDALMLVIVGAGKPQLPTYPENSPMYGVKRD
jgi:mannose-6-phosphate isomerase-like protein (cupin superfamily)